MRTIRDCSVCVVGGAGFLGSHLVNTLIEDRNCQVMVIDNLVAGKKEYIHPKAKFEYADITASESHLLKLFKMYKVQYVWNMAAHPYVPFSYERPVYVADVNFMGALKLINAATEAECKGTLQVSSAEIYGEGSKTENSEDGFKIRETDTIVPHSTYGVAKAAIDMEIQCRWKEAGTKCIALRQFNCVGPRETHEYIVPEIISQLAKSNTVRLGNNSFRDFIYAGDAVKIAVELLEKGNWGEVYNSGSETGIKMYDLAHLIGSLMHRTSIEIAKDESRVRKWEIWHLLSDNKKLYSVIDYRPQVSLEQALKKTIDDFYDSGKKWSWQL
jgi:UDP-glucose 4-epimerase